MPWYLYLAVKQLFPTGQRLHISFFAAMSILGVMLGVMVLLVVQTVMNGFDHEIRQTIVRANGDVTINSSGLIEDYEQIIETMEMQDGLVGISPYAAGIVMLQHDYIPVFPGIRGIDVEREGTVSDIESFLVQGSLEDLDDESILLSSGLARRVRAGKGSVVEVYTPLMLEMMKEDEIILPRELVVAGIYETGWHEIDENSALCDLGLMQELYGLDGDVVHGFTLKLQEGVDATDYAQQINDKLIAPPLRAESWEAMNRDFLFILQLEKTMMFFIILFIILVASFSITNSLMTSVVRKTKEIGLLGAMGATPKQIAAAFCAQGLIIGISGTALGVLGAVLAIEYRNTIVQFFAKITHSEAALLKFYQFADLPAKYAVSDVVIIVGFSIVITTLAALLPAIKASRLEPAKAIRHG